MVNKLEDRPNSSIIFTGKYIDNDTIKILDAKD